MELTLKRGYTENGVNSILFYLNKPICFMIELPWLFNIPRISCIPEGRYELVERYNNKFKQHWELLNVPNRSGILIHPANNAKKELKGCLAPVSYLVADGMGIKSEKAMNAIRKLFNGKNKKKERHFITITEEV